MDSPETIFSMQGDEIFGNYLRQLFEQHHFMATSNSSYFTLLLVPSDCQIAFDIKNCEFITAIVSYSEQHIHYICELHHAHTCNLG